MTPAPGDRVRIVALFGHLDGAHGVVVRIDGDRVLVDFGELGQMLMFAGEVVRA